MAIEKFDSNIIGDTNWYKAFYNAFMRRWTIIPDSTAKSTAADKSIPDAVDSDFKLMAENPFKPKKKKMVEFPIVDTQLLRNKIQDIMLKVNEIITLWEPEIEKIPILEQRVDELEQKVTELEANLQAHEDLQYSSNATGDGPHGHTTN